MLEGTGKQACPRSVQLLNSSVQSLCVHTVRSPGRSPGRSLLLNWGTTVGLCKSTFPLPSQPFSRQFLCGFFLLRSEPRLWTVAL